MKAKFLNLLLAVVLCYGQLAVHVHAVSHLHGNGSHELLVHADCHLETRDHRHSHYPADVSGDAELDCAIYHAVMSLNAVIRAGQIDLVVALVYIDVVEFSSRNRSGAVPVRQSIRAPPSFS